MSCRFRLLLLTMLLLPVCASAHLLVIDQRMPPVGIANKGELVDVQGKLSYQPWNSARLSGKVRVILHMAGRLAAKDESAAISQALSTVNLPDDRYQTTLIVDTDDAIPGSAMFVTASLKNSKRQSPSTQIIIDSQGAARHAWQLKEGGAAVVVLDRQGRVRFAREGALMAAEVVQVLDLIASLSK